MGLIADACLRTGTTLVITADHGNAEKMINELTGEKDTKHNANPVPLSWLNSRFARPRNAEEIEGNESAVVGSFATYANGLKINGYRKAGGNDGQDLTLTSNELHRQSHNPTLINTLALYLAKTAIPGFSVPSGLYPLLVIASF
jgi:hypothetical protein